MNPKISIVIPTYNRTQYLAYSLYLYQNQVLNDNGSQAMKDFEIIVIDDGSNDGDLSVADVCSPVKEFGRQRGFDLRCFRSERKKSPVYQSSGALINFAVKNVAKGDIVIYSDPEVMPFPTFVDNHYRSHTPGNKFMYTEVGTEIPNTFGGFLTDEGKKYIVKGLTLKMWLEHSQIFGTKEYWFANESLCDIEKFWEDTWMKIRKLPKSYIGDPYKGYSYPSGEQHFWGFQGSQAGMSFSKDIFIEVGGWDESISLHNRWAGEDGEFGARMAKAGVVCLENPEIRAVHIYHTKPATYTDEERKTLVTNKNDDPAYRVANVGKDWGNQEELMINEINLEAK